ncbi:MAG: hypothetical protein WC247_05340 [Porticoccaceae bacterium]
MAMEDKLLIVVNPAAATQPAVERVINTALNGPFTELPDVHLLVAVDPSSTDTSADNEAVFRNATWLAEMGEQFRAANLDTTMEISWSKDWADGILHAAMRANASSILVSHPGVNTNRAFSDEFWYLVRNSPLPVSVVQSTRPPNRRPVMIALDLRDKGLSELNQRILHAGQIAAQMYGAELHLVHAYDDSSNYPDRSKLVELSGIPNERIHLQAGAPNVVMQAVAREIDPDIVIIGATRRSGVRAALQGRKLGAILTTIEQDLLFIT